MSHTPLGRSRISIIGAGAVGATIAYATQIRGLVREIVLVDTNTAKAEAEAMDLRHGSQFTPPTDVIAGSIEDCRGSSVVIITAGAKQKPGQSRLDLLTANVKLFREIVPAVHQTAPEAILLIVSNPVDVLTYITQKLTGLPSWQVFGSGTVLDTSRFRGLLAEYLEVSVTNVHAYIVGEHGDSEVPLWSSAQVGNIPLIQFAEQTGKPLTDEVRHRIFSGVRDAAGQVIAAKGATNWAIGLAAVRILEALFRDEGAILTVSQLITNFQSMNDVCLSLPTLVGAQGPGAPLWMSGTAEELAALHRSAEVLQQRARAAGF